MSCLKHALASLLNLLQPVSSVIDNYQHCELQAKGPDAFSPPPDVRRDKDTTGDNPDEAEPGTEVQHAERIVQNQLTPQFVTHQQ